MTLKLPEGQKHRIRELPNLGAAAFVKVQLPTVRYDDVYTIVQYAEDELEGGMMWFVEEPQAVYNSDSIGFETAEEAIVCVEEIFNRKYFYLPTCDDWVASGQTFTFKDAGKVLELVFLAQHTRWSTVNGEWYSVSAEVLGEDKTFYRKGDPEPQDYNLGVTIHTNSPIWEALGV
jgi:hypothetical protein